MHCDKSFLQPPNALQTAARLIEWHGEVRALLFAEGIAMSRMDAGDSEGERRWLAVIKAIEELGRRKPSGSERTQ
jgi:hypothetical protein